ncbi:thyrotropin releasing hormone [Spea bombifrons]|uniref:thyrotropin releasing hormone n=1 Tax=Spea bombifrons TaxID=233779 RepID=UPI00234BBEEB|nr:thyrotropin releasing hormone [Spea bombifrons]
MTSAWWLLLLGATLSQMVGTQEQPLPDDEELQAEDNVDLSNMLQRAQRILIRSMLQRMEEEEQNDKESEPPALEWISKRQHPGKRLLDEMEKRQHPGKREEGDWYLDLPKRQHPGRRSPMGDQYLDSSNSALELLNDISKRQHPGKRNPSHIKRQHPGKRGWDEEEDTELSDLRDVEKRQHPGKRYMESESLDYMPPCEGSDPFNCSKGSLLLELLDNVNRGRMEEKRQHPGRRAVWEGEVPLVQE